MVLQLLHRLKLWSSGHCRFWWQVDRRQILILGRHDKLEGREGSETTLSDKDEV